MHTCPSDSERIFDSSNRVWHGNASSKASLYVLPPTKPMTCLRLFFCSSSLRVKVLIVLQPCVYMRIQPRVLPHKVFLHSSNGAKYRYIQPHPGTASYSLPPLSLSSISLYLHLLNSFLPPLLLRHIQFPKPCPSSPSLPSSSSPIQSSPEAYANTPTAPPTTYPATPSPPSRNADRRATPV